MPLSIFEYRRCRMLASGLAVMLLGLTVALTAAVPQARAQNPSLPRIVIDNPNVAPMQIAIPEFIAGTRDDVEMATDIANVITANLERSGLFAPIDRGAFIERIVDLETPPRFADWRLIAAPVLVTGRVTTLPSRQVRVEFILWDVYSGRSMVGLQFNVVRQGWRRVAHLISDKIYEQLTGEEGYFDTRIVYVAESGTRADRERRLAIMDQDGANPMFLTDGSTHIMTPRFSPTDQEIVYVSIRAGIPRVYLFNIESGEQEIVGDFPGITYAPTFSPSGRQIVMSMARGDNSDIYIMDLRSRRMERLTSHPAIDTSPSFSPDGKQITFNSDRGGSQQIYVMDQDGSNVRRISFGEGRYATPVWSPRGDLIAFTKMLKGRFYIGVMRPNGSGERLLTESYHDEGPTWSPNGRVLMFFRERPPSQAENGQGLFKLWSVDLTGHNEREIKTPGDGSHPAWSPLLSQGPG